MRPSVIVKTYRNQRQYQNDARKMARRKYKVVSVAYENRNPGFFRFIMLGFLFPLRNRLIVTYALA